MIEQLKDYAIVHNSYDMANTSDVQSLSIVSGYTMNDALLTFMNNTRSKGYVPVKIALVGTPNREHLALKPVNLTVHTIERYTV